MPSRNTPDIHACDVAAVSQVGNGAPQPGGLVPPFPTPPRDRSPYRGVPPARAPHLTNLEKTKLHTQQPSSSRIPGGAKRYRFIARPANR